MNLTVYRQSSKVRSDGTVVYKGEDARPYASDQMILVADGLGGASAIRHQNINEDLFCEDKVSNILFEVCNLKFIMFIFLSLPRVGIDLIIMVTDSSLERVLWIEFYIKESR